MLTNLKTGQKNKRILTLVLIGVVILGLILNLIPTYIACYLLTKYTQFTIPFWGIYLLFMIPQMGIKIIFNKN